MKKKLTLIDYQLNQFAKSKNGQISKDETKGMWLPKDFESRSVTWRKNKLNYGLGVYPEIENDRITKWHFYYHCWYDSKNNRYYKDRNLITTSEIDDIIYKIDELIETAEQDFKIWKKEDLRAI